MEGVKKGLNIPFVAAIGRKLEGRRTAGTLESTAARMDRADVSRLFSGWGGYSQGQYVRRKRRLKNGFRCVTQVKKPLAFLSPKGIEKGERYAKGRNGFLACFITVWL